MRAYAATTHPGRARRINEDCFGADAEQGVWLVADGVGGHEHGEVAATIVRDTVLQQVSLGQSLMSAILSAHDAVLREIARRPSKSTMGSTVVAVQIFDGGFSLAWIGDSRAYLWDGRKLTQLTRDHSYVRHLVDRGKLGKHEMLTHPERHALTQSLGVSPDMQLDPGELQGVFSQRQQILLCSDGLTDELSDEEIARELGRHDSAQAQVDALMRAALAAGGRDNITVVVVGNPAR